MKKSLISLFTVIVMLFSIAGLSVSAETDVTSVASLSEIIGKDVYGSAANIGENVIENDKYVFVVEGAPVTVLENNEIRLNDRIHIFEKPNDEHIDYKYLTAVSHSSNTAGRNLPARGVAVVDDVLFVAWGNSVYAKDTHGGYPSGGQTLSYAAAYDVSDVEVGETLTGKAIQTSLEQRTTTHAPFTRGGILVADEENGKVYISGVQRENYKKREYFAFDAADVADYVTGRASSLTRETVFVPTQSMNTAKFVVKDGYLFEILHQKAGLVAFSNDITLKNADGTAKNNTICIWDVAAFDEIGAPATTTATYMTDYKKAEYTTDTAGGVVIKDTDVYGDYMYVATTKGLEIVDISSVKETEDVVFLSLEDKLLADTLVNGLEVIGEKLYVGTDSQMLIYDISDGIPSLIYTLDNEGGFIDFEINEDENMLYALSAGTRGGVMLIDLDLMSGGLNVSGVKFTQNDKSITEMGNGVLSFSADVVNGSGDDIEFKAMFALYKENKLIDLSITDYSLAPTDDVKVYDTLALTADDDCVAKVIFLNQNDDSLVPMFTEDGIEFEMELGNTPDSSDISADAVNFGEIDTEGKLNVSGTVSALKNRAVLIVAENTEASSDDRLSGYRYIDVVTVDKDGKYGTDIKAPDSGEYAMSVSKTIGAGKATKLITVPRLAMTVQNSVEVPGIESYMYVEFEYGQNIETFDFEMTFDSDLMTVGTDIASSDEFTVSDVSAENGKLTAKFTKKNDIALTTEKNEFCVIPVKVADDAALGDYEISLIVNVKDDLSNELEADCISGTLSLVESTPKYEALDDAIEALKALKKAENILVDDYLSEKVKIEDAREKVETAYEYFIRDSQLGTELVKNLADAEAKLVELKPYYDAVELLNNADSENLMNVLKENKEYFAIDDDALEIYENMEDKEAVDSVLLETDFEKPSDILKAFYEELILEAFKDTSWQNVEMLLDFADDASLMDTSEYEKLTAKQKAVANKALALTEYDSISELESALEDAVEEAKTEEKKKPSGGGGGSSSGRTDEYYVNPSEKPAEPIKPAEPEVKPEEIFSDISEYGWAKEAIEALYKSGVLNGKAEKSFAPNESVTREEFAKIVALAFDIKAEKAEISFSDVDGNAWYAEYVYALSEAGIINGRDDGSFGIGDEITRQEIAVILERVATYKGIEIGDDSAEINFADGDEIADFAKSAIKKMCSAGIISGYPDGSVKPLESANRAQAAQLVYKILLNAQ